MSKICFLLLKIEYCEQTETGIDTARYMQRILWKDVNELCGRLEQGDLRRWPLCA